MYLIHLGYYEIEYLLKLLERERMGNGSWDPDKDICELLIDKLKDARRKLLMREDRENDP